MSQHSLLNIQEISSRTFHNQQSMMDTSIEQIERLNQSNFGSMIKGGNRIMSINPEERIRELQRENQRYKLTLRTYINRIQQMQGSSSTAIYEKQLMVRYNQKEIQLAQVQDKYERAIEGLKQTVTKNEMLHKQIQRLRKKIDESQLSNNFKLSLDYSKDHQAFQRSQNLLSNLSIANSNYQIEMVNMKDSLVILEKDNQHLVATNEEYEEKLALLSQEIERLRGVIENSRRENQKIKGSNKQQQDIIRKIETDNSQIKNIIERLRVENRDLKNSSSALSVQLQEYHEKLVYKETLLNDLHERENKMQMALKTKQSRIRDLQSKADYLQKSTRNIEEQSNMKNTEYAQQLARTRAALNESLNYSKKLEIEKQQILRENKQISIKCDQLKRQCDSIFEQKQNLIRNIEDLDRDRLALVKQREYLLIEKDQILHDNEQLREGLNKYESNFKQLTQQRTKMNDSMIRHFEQKQRITVKDYQVKIQSIIEQKNNEIAAKTNEVNEYRIEMGALSSELSNYRSELAVKTTEINQLKQSTLSQSTLIDTTRRDCEEKIKQKKEAITELRSKIQQLQKLLQQSRKQKDMIFHDKNNEVRQYHQKIENVSKQTKKIERQAEIWKQDIQNYKKVVNDNDNIIRDLTQRLEQADKRTINLTNQLERIASLLKEKQTVIIELNTQYRHVNSAFEEKNKEVFSLREINQKISSNLSRVDENKGNFQIFMKQIERLNELVGSKEKQLKNQRVQISKLIQKIDLVYHQQQKIIKTIENTCLDDAKRETQLNNQLSQLRQYIGQLNEDNSYTLQGIQQQGGNIISILNKNQSENKDKLKDQISQFQVMLEQKEREIKELKDHVADYEQKMKENEESGEKEEEIYQKIIELTRENAAIKEQLIMNNSQFEAQLSMKDHDFRQLQSKMRETEKIQKKEVLELKEYINQRQLALTDANQQSRCLKDSVVMKESQYERIIFEKQHEIDQLKEEVKDLEQKMRQMTHSIDSRLDHIQKTSGSLASSNKELEKCKIMIKKYEQELQRYQFQQADKNRLVAHEKEIEKLQKIIEIRNIQISNNEESYFKLKNKLQDSERQLIKMKSTIRQLKQNQYQSSELQYQIKQLSQEKSQQEYRIREILQLKNKNLQLQRDLHILQSKLKESQQKLSLANGQIENLKIQLQKLFQYNSQSISKIQRFEKSQSEKQNLYDRIAELEDEIERVTASWREIEIQYNFMRNNEHQSKIHLRAYEHKNLELEKEYLKLKQILGNINNENSKLNTKNHFFEVELKKAQIFQQKIQVLNGEINRLSFENINLNEEVNSCKLALSGESSEERQTQEQLGLIIILSTEIQSLRNRIKEYEYELATVRNERLGKFRK